MSVYYMFNKPRGCITACSDARQKTVMDYFSDDIRAGLFPVGRLDKDTEGFLLVTDDGMLSFELMKPEHCVPKTYFFWAQGTISDDKIAKLASGVSIYSDTDKITAPARLEVLSVKTLGDIKPLLNDDDLKLGRRRQALPVTSGLITITEGKKHQVKRMIKHIGCRVVYLKRVAIGSLFLDEEIPLGEYRQLSEKELELLKMK